MDLHLDLAFSEWWIIWRDREPVRTALNRALVMHCESRIEEILSTNKVSGREPASWGKLATAIGREPGNMTRVRQGKQRASTSDLYAIAMALKLPVEDLFPDRRSWLQLAVSHLCNGQLPPQYVEAYVRYVDSDPKGYNPHLDRIALESVRDGMAGRLDAVSDLERAIENSARHIGKTLEPIAYEE